MNARILLPLLLVIVIASSVACRAERGDLSEGQPSSAAPVMADGEWELRVDRAWDAQSADVNSQSDVLSESSFRKVTSGVTYRIVVSGRGSEVSVEGTSIKVDSLKGQRAPVMDSRLRYELGEGTFAGGLFAAWQTGGGLQGELTIYGSGRPIVGSVRGVLVQLP